MDWAGAAIITDLKLCVKFYKQYTQSDGPTSWSILSFLFLALTFLSTVDSTVSELAEHPNNIDFNKLSDYDVAPIRGHKGLFRRGVLGLCLQCGWVLALRS